jgi:hypothetical protein
LADPNFPAPTLSIFERDKHDSRNLDGISCTLAALLTDDDVATLKHLAQEGMGENTLRALASDLVSEAWCRLETGSCEGLLVIAWRLIARSTVLEASSMRPSVRKRSKMARREMAPLIGSVVRRWALNDHNGY